MFKSNQSFQYGISSSAGISLSLDVIMMSLKLEMSLKSKLLAYERIK